MDFKRKSAPPVSKVRNSVSATINDTFHLHKDRRTAGWGRGEAEVGNTSRHTVCLLLLHFVTLDLKCLRSECNVCCKTKHVHWRFGARHARCIRICVTWSSRFSCHIQINLKYSRQIFEKSSNIKIHENPSSGRRDIPCGWTDMTKLTVAFRNFANAPKSQSVSAV